LARAPKGYRTITVLNPKTAELSMQMLANIKYHHLNRALTVLGERQAEGRFPKRDFKTALSYKSALRTVSGPKAIVAEQLKFPSGIHFITPHSAKVYAAVVAFINAFTAKAPKSKKSKTNPWRYGLSLLYFVNGSRYTVEAFFRHLQTRQTSTDVYEIVNAAPYASIVEEQKRIMYDIAKDVSAKFKPGVIVGYNFITSSSIGLTYTGTAQGGPQHDTASYDLPMVRFGIVGSFAPTFVNPKNRNRARSHRGKRGR